MKKIFITLTFLTTISLASTNATELIQNISARNIQSLNGRWSYLIDPYETGYYNYRRVPYEKSNNPDGGFMNNKKQTNKNERIEYEFSPFQTLEVPADWNSQEEKLRFYEGTIWYEKDFTISKKEGKRYFIYFGAVNYDAKVYINGKNVGVHIGGFTAFNFEITDNIIDGDNFVVLKVDNVRKKEAVPTDNTDWWNYGGITRDVFIAEMEQSFIIDYKVQLTKANSKEISFFVKYEGTDIANKNVDLSIPEIGLNKTITTNELGECNTTLSVKNLNLWSPENPKLYNVIISSDKEKITDRIGFRTIETKGTDILLNGKPIFLRGVCIHEENPLREARATGIADARTLLGWAKDLNCNFVRLAHYPHNEYMLKYADEIGILVWSEIPVYWTIDWKNEATNKNAHNQLKDMISRDKNRASIIIWSIGNETPVIPARLEFMSSLAKDAKSLDDTRLISAALELHYIGDKEPNTAVIEDPLADYLDVMSFNEYIGWYGNELKDIVNYNIKFKALKPVLVSEVGAGALGGYHADINTRWSEEFQAEFYKQQIKLLDKIPQIKGMTPWILADFKSPKRQNPKYQDFWNRKGLISNNGQKKMAFYVLKDYYKSKK